MTDPQPIHLWFGAVIVALTLGVYYFTMPPVPMDGVFIDAAADILALKDKPPKGILRAHIDRRRAQEAAPQDTGISVQDPENLQARLDALGPSHDGAVERDLRAALKRAQDTGDAE